MLLLAFETRSSEAPGRWEAARATRGLARAVCSPLRAGPDPGLPPPARAGAQPVPRGQRPSRRPRSSVPSPPSERPEEGSAPRSPAESRGRPQEEGCGRRPGLAPLLRRGALTWRRLPGLPRALHGGSGGGACRPLTAGPAEPARPAARPRSPAYLGAARAPAGPRGGAGGGALPRGVYPAPSPPCGRWWSGVSAGRRTRGRGPGRHLRRAGRRGPRRQSALPRGRDGTAAEPCAEETRRGGPRRGSGTGREGAGPLLPPPPSGSGARSTAGSWRTPLGVSAGRGRGVWRAVSGGGAGPQRGSQRGSRPPRASPGAAAPSSLSGRCGEAPELAASPGARGLVGTPRPEWAKLPRGRCWPARAAGALLCLSAWPSPPGRRPPLLLRQSRGWGRSSTGGSCGAVAGLWAVGCLPRGRACCSGDAVCERGYPQGQPGSWAVRLPVPLSLAVYSAGKRSRNTEPLEPSLSTVSGAISI